MLEMNNTNHLDIPWETLEGMVKGISSIDLNQMNCFTVEEAEAFILNYGYDYGSPTDRAEVKAIQKEAVSFIRRKFLDPDMVWEDIGEENLGLEIPADLIADWDVRILIVEASTGSGLRQRWACAILKVMHTICHINNAILFQHFNEARKQILSRYEPVISHTEQGQVVFGGNSGLKLSLAGFEIKDEKSRDSMIMKLLCKRENVAEEVFDMVGVRIITHTPAEAILALEVLRSNRIVIFPNIIPSRSRNSLIDFDAFKLQYEELLEEYQWGLSDLNETIDLIRKIPGGTPATEGFNPRNASTIPSYQSIHITERQLVRFKPPGCVDEVRFFFPYEIQIVDEASYYNNMAGSSAHMLYKQNQLIQARRRVLGPLFIALRSQKRRANQTLEPEPLP